MTENSFEKGTSSNMPCLNILAVASFISSNEKFVGAELRGVKNFRAGRECYGDDAIGYVQLHRSGGRCIVKAKVTPEHRIRAKCYAVTLVLDEANGHVESVTCHDCPASEGGCKHAIALLMWVNRRSEEPSPTSVDCYWKKSRLSSIGTSKKFVKAADLYPSKSAPMKRKHTVRREPGSFLGAVLKKGFEKKANSQLLKHFQDIIPIENLSLNNLAFWFVKEGNNITVDDFVNFCSHKMSDELCNDAAQATLLQSESSLWHNLRFARITASKIYEASRCKTDDGSLVEAVFGAKVPDSKPMKRGRDLEAAVLEEVQSKLGKKVQKIGLVLNKDWPMLGASPDGICDDFIVEIKCPSSDKTVVSYIKNGELTPKCFAQMQLQMFMTGKKFGWFCVASPKFEETLAVEMYRVGFDASHTKTLIEDAMLFWKTAIFSKLIKKNVK